MTMNRRPLHRPVHEHPGTGGHPHEDVVRVLHALAEPTRLSVVHLLAAGPCRVVELTASLGLAQSTVSAHLAVLREAGLVTATPEGRATRYALADAELDEVLAATERLVARQRGAAPRAGGPARGADA